MACEYCRDNVFSGHGVPFFSNDDNVDEPAVYIEDGQLALEYEQVIDYFGINYCPNCGESLGGD